MFELHSFFFCIIIFHYTHLKIVLLVFLDFLSALPLLYLKESSHSSILIFDSGSCQSQISVMDKEKKIHPTRQCC